MSWTDIIGQENSVARLKAFGDYHVSKGGTPGHILLIGREGMGKNLIATSFAANYGMSILSREAETFVIKGDLSCTLTNLRDRTAFLLSNVQQLKHSLLELLSSAMRDYKVDVMIGTGPRARLHSVQTGKFTLICTATKKTECPQLLSGLFSLVLSLEEYSQDQLQEIAKVLAERNGYTLEPPVAGMLALNCDGRPHHLELLTLRLAKTLKKKVITESDAVQAFSAFGMSVRPTISPLGDNDILSVSGERFEQLISDLLNRMGFRTELTKTTGDGGIDIVAMLDRPIVGGRYLFQCKRYQPGNLVGAPTVRDFYGAVIADRAVKGVLITTSDFSAQAREFAQKVGLELIALDQLQLLLNKHGEPIQPPSHAMSEGSPMLVSRGISDSEAAECESGLPEKRPASSPPQILVVDDEEPIREIICSMLSSANYQCRAVAGGQEALTLLDSGEVFDLVIHDLLNSPIDGIDLLCRLRRNFPDIPVVVASAVHDVSVALAVLRHGAYDYLLEPFEREQLLLVVRRALEYRRLKLENRT
ncbi:MAG: restriction endonuclease [Acidobacteriota bacterium]|nr:restriction endonuclease [Acidobacteriota bacterium]